MTYDAVNLSQLAPPDVIEELDFETILAAMKTELIGLMPELADVLALESEPVVKILEVCAFREMLVRARVNDAARAVLLATATGTDLEHLGALYGVRRLLLDGGDDGTIPPIPPTYEDDDSLRLRIQLAPEAFSVAGPSGAYEFHARGASALVADVAVASPEPGQVQVTVLSRDGDGTADQALLDAVSAALTDEQVRPLCDTVIVQSASLTDYQIEAELTVAPGPDSEVVRARSEAAVATYAAAVRQIGQPVTLSGLYAALHGTGVLRVDLTQPLAEVDPGAVGVANCTAITVTVAA